MHTGYIILFDDPEILPYYYVALPKEWVYALYRHDVRPYMFFCDEVLDEIWGLDLDDQTIATFLPTYTYMINQYKYKTSGYVYGARIRKFIHDALSNLQTHIRTISKNKKYKIEYCRYSKKKNLPYILILFLPEI